MLTTAHFARPLLSGAVVVVAVFSFVSSPAGAAQAERCPGLAGRTHLPEAFDTATGATVCLVNAERTSRGLDALRRDSDLARAARRHAADMVRREYFAHVTPGGTGLSDRLRAAGYGQPGDGWRAGEALGWGTGYRASPNALVDAWMDSPRHRRLLLEDVYRELGLGVVTGAPMATTSDLPGATYTLELGVIRKRLNAPFTIR